MQSSINFVISSRRWQLCHRHALVATDLPSQSQDCLIDQSTLALTSERQNCLTGQAILELISERHDCLDSQAILAPNSERQDCLSARIAGNRYVLFRADSHNNR